MSPVVEAQGLGRDYTLSSHTVSAVSNVNLTVEPGTLVAIHGRSGSGKTTLLNLIGGLDQPTSGKIWLDGTDLTTASDTELVEFRRHKIGFIFQAFGLIPILTAAENVQFPMRLTRVAVADREERGRVLLEMVGLGDRADHRPHELSGGEQQRVAIARALANGPQLLIADEPTGQLDSRTGRSIVELVSALVRSENVAAVFATHDPAPLAVADRILELSDGSFV
jgi:putative ABC transport system ATP-binding protein